MSDSNSKNVILDIPQELAKGKNILVKIDEKNLVKEKIATFHSFGIITDCNYDLTVKKLKVPMKYLLELLTNKYKLPTTIPYIVSYVDTLDCYLIDSTPLCYGGPNVWYFNYNDIKCSLTFMQNKLCIRVHDLSFEIATRVLKSLLDELYEYAQSKIPSTKDEYLTVYSTNVNINGYSWRILCSRIHRKLETIYIESKYKDQLVNELKRFYESSQLYDKYGVTWKRVHLFHGPPGSGKTSTVLALASIFKKNIAKMTITPTMNSIQLETLFQSLPDNTFLLLEDVDALFTERKSENSIDFSTLLNCMDGLTTKRGLVLFMTTNYLTKLDTAFIRPGRVDLNLEFKIPGKEEIKKALQMLGEDYAHEHDEFLEKYGEIMSIAELQKYLFECIMNNKKSIL